MNSYDTLFFPETDIFNDKREQFSQLIRDLNERKERLVARLSGLTKDSNPPPSGGKPHCSRHNIESSLLQEYGLEHATSGTDLHLWQANIVSYPPSLHYIYPLGRDDMTRVDFQAEHRLQGH